MFVCMFAHMYACVYIFNFIHICFYVSMYNCTCVHACMYANVHGHVFHIHCTMNTHECICIHVSDSSFYTPIVLLKMSLTPVVVTYLVNVNSKFLSWILSLSSVLLLNTF